MADLSENEAGPTGHAFRRAVTISDTKPFRRRPTFGRGAESSTFAEPRRRSSNCSEISQEARDMLNPGPEADGDGQERSRLDVLPLAFALLPALGGICVQGGNAFMTDLMLLALGGLFLQYSLTQPWAWYHSAQQVRLSEEYGIDSAVDSDSEAEGVPTPSNLDGVHEDKGFPTGPVKTKTKADQTRPPRTRDAALRELYRHELFSLISCFVFPVLGAYVLHAIRGQLTRPSEGLVSNYNLTIFILGAEIRPLRHLSKLVRARTLHLQRIVHANPYQREETKGQLGAETLEELMRRLDEIEAKAESANSPADQADAGSKAAKRTDVRREKDNLLREMRSQLQPELDKITNGLRRTHKQQMMLASQLDSRFRYFDQRLNDAVSLAAAASRNSKGLWNFVGAVADWILTVLLLPFQVMAQVAAWPLGVVSSLFGGLSRSTSSDRARRTRNGRATTPSKLGTERVTRPMKR